MTQIQVDSLLEQRLGTLKEHVELRGPDGRVMGHYFPDAAYKKMLYDSFEVPYSDEEIARRRAETGGRTLKEIWSRLGRP